MNWLLPAAAALVFLFGFVIFFGAPYLPTLGRQSAAALDLLALKPGQTLLELGCGDGTVLCAAAARGIRAVGYELNPLLFGIAWLRCLRYRRLAKVRFGNFWRAKWPPADGIYVFLLDRYMAKLDKKITQEISRSVKLVSYAFKIPGRRPDGRSAGMYLYEYRR